MLLCVGLRKALLGQQPSFPTSWSLPYIYVYICRSSPQNEYADPLAGMPWAKEQAVGGLWYPRFQPTRHLQQTTSPFFAGTRQFFLSSHPWSGMQIDSGSGAGGTHTRFSGIVEAKRLLTVRRGQPRGLGVRWHLHVNKQ